jgi:2Fe-2S ferredoxin
MPKVTFVAHNGERRTVEAPVGESVMRAAILNNVPGIDADCGGECACATCHVFVDAAWLDKCGAPSELETSMLSFAETAKPNSRLSCQIKLTEALDGLVVETPVAQH